MSKALAIPIALALAGPAAPLIALGMGAAWLAKKARDFTASLSPEDRAYLLPFGADRERAQLEAATVMLEPLSGLDFCERPLPAQLPPAGIPALPAPTRADEVPSLSQSQREEVLRRVEATARAVGFRTDRRALPPKADVLVFDLTQPERPPKAVPRKIRREPS